MKMIAHRGLLDGPDARLDNHPDSISHCLKQGIDAEIDVWFIDHAWHLGHDGPRYLVTDHFIQQQGLWIHAKSAEASAQLSRLHQLHPALNFFWHQHDDRVLTSQGYWWTEPGQQLLHNSIAVLPEITLSMQDLPSCVTWPCHGICSDFINILGRSL